MNALLGWSEQSAEVMRIGPRDPLAITFTAGENTLRIERDGFFVNGEPVQQGPDHARKVHAAFLKWLRLQGMAV